MDLANILLFCLMSLIIGAVLMLLIQYYAFVRYFKLPDDDADSSANGGVGNEDIQTRLNEKFTLPDTMMMDIKASDPQSKTTVMGINLILQFLYFELRHSNSVRKWFHRKLSLELDELITKTTTGKLFDKLSIRDLELGNHFPEVKNFRVHNVELHEQEGHIENLELLLDLQYQGNFRLSIDADMMLGKKGFLSLKVKHISGLARLQFTRHPYTHWSLSFVGDPKVDLAVESQFQGRQMQSNVTSLISNQIRKAIRRKHTLPNYKLRYKPFFNYVEEDLDLTGVAPNGVLEINVSELSRLRAPGHLTRVYCTLTLAPFPWVQAKQKNNENIIISIDLEIHKAKNQQIGIVFKQNDQLVIIEAIIPNTPAAKANIKKNDILQSIEGKRVTHINSVAKIIKSLNRNKFILRIERTVSGLIKNDAILEDLIDEYEDFNDFNISFSKNSDSVQIGSSSTTTASVAKLTRINSKECTSSGESSHSNTPSNSPFKSNENLQAKPKASSRNNSEGRSTSSMSEEPVQKAAKAVEETTSFPQHSTIDCDFNTFIRLDDLCSFNLLDSFVYLNLGVFGRSKDDNVLLGYLNIPINNILVECNESNLGHYLKKFPLTPPDVPNLSNHPLSMQSGFDGRFCYGDVLLSFVWNSSQILADNCKKPKLSSKGSVDKLDDDKNNEVFSTTKRHDFIRTHFHRSTQCDFCGKKIWLKDAVQCRDCAMCCHKKCIVKCQDSTVCGTGEISSSAQQPEFTVTEAPTLDISDDNDDPEDLLPTGTKLETHRQSFSDLLTQGIKRVNSASNLAIPGISSLNQGSRSLPPTPQHSPRKQSLASPTSNPFITIIQKLEMLPDNLTELRHDQITELTDPLIVCGSNDELMSLAKTASKMLYADNEPPERVEKINLLLSKIRVALDSETSDQVQTNVNNVVSTNIIDNVIFSPDTNLLLQTKGPENNRSKAGSTATQFDNQNHDLARKAFLVGKSEERINALSIIMLHLCSGLQHAQGFNVQ